MKMIIVDFNDLKRTIPNVVGWVKVNGANINYPFVQANDNKYYLTHSFNKSYNAAGWVFLDYENNNTNNKNTIIYAYGRTDKTMFRTLRKVLNKVGLIIQIILLLKYLMKQKIVCGKHLVYILYLLLVITFKQTLMMIRNINFFRYD